MYDCRRNTILKYGLLDYVLDGGFPPEFLQMGQEYELLKNLILSPSNIRLIPFNVYTNLLNFLEESEHYDLLDKLHKLNFIITDDFIIQNKLNCEL